MSLWTRMFGLRDRSGLSDELISDLARLKKATAALGQTKSSLGLKGLSRADQLHLIHRRLGERLGSSSAKERAAVASVFVAADHALPANVRKASSANNPAEVKSVLETGCANLRRTMSDEQIRAIHAHLKPRRLLLGHVPQIGAESVASIDEVSPDKSYACYEYLDLWSSPHILEFATQDRVLDLAQGYLGCTPTMYSINAFWSFPNRQPHPYSQVFHRDWEDYRSLVIFTLLTPVEVPEEGAHYYVEASHEFARFEALLKAQGVSAADRECLSGRDGTLIAPVASRLFQGTAQRFDGPAGTSFCGDGYGLHRAVVPHSRPRLLLWFRFGNFFNETMYKLSLHTRDRAAAQRIIQRIPDTPRHRYVFRHMLDALASV